MSYLGRSAKLSRKTQEKTSFLATAGQTVATGLSYVATFVEVHVNGILLTDTSDYTATNGNSITFTVALGLNDEVTIVSLKTFALADHYNKIEADANLAALVDSSPAALDTLNELAAALGDDANFSTTVNNSIALKAPIASPTFTGNATASGLIINSGASNQALLLDGSTGYNTAINFKSNNVLKWSAQALGDGSNAFRFYNFTTNTESLRIDSSGNVLVGTTDAAVGVGNTNVGTAIGVSGYAAHSRSGNASLFLNRTSSDGEIARFQRDGTTVGSIAAVGGDLTIQSGAAGHQGLRLGSSYIAPVGVGGAFEDNTTDLGLSSVRFKDLHLSGGVYLGGTGSANKLDDYETGTFTATLVGPNATTVGTYTKVGNVVNFSIEFAAVSTSGHSGHISINGLPFSVVSSPRPTYAVQSYGMSLNGGTYPIAMSESNGSSITMYGGKDGSGWSVIYHNGNTIYLGVTGVYRTNA